MEQDQHAGLPAQERPRFVFNEDNVRAEVPEFPTQANQENRSVFLPCRPALQSRQVVCGAVTLGLGVRDLAPQRDPTSGVHSADMDLETRGQMDSLFAVHRHHVSVTDQQ